MVLSDLEQQLAGVDPVEEAEEGVGEGGDAALEDRLGGDKTPVADELADAGDRLVVAGLALLVERG